MIQIGDLHSVLLNFEKSVNPDRFILVPQPQNSTPNRTSTGNGNKQVSGQKSIRPTIDPGINLNDPDIHPMEGPDGVIKKNGKILYQCIHCEFIAPCSSVKERILNSDWSKSFSFSAN